MSMIKTSSINKKRSGFVAMTSLVMLILFGILGVAYWFSSRQNTDMVFAEAQRIKARNFAQAAVEKVKMNIVNQYRMNNFRLEYPKNDVRTNKEYNMKFDKGEYRVISVRPYSLGSMKYYNIPYEVNGDSVGRYDIWEVVTQGISKPTRIIAEIHVLIKTYRYHIVY